MNKEILEKMAWLYEQGFKPDYVDVGAGMLCPYDPNEPFNKELDAAWFSESRLWSLLPTRIRKDTLHSPKGNEQTVYMHMADCKKVLYHSIYPIAQLKEKSDYILKVIWLSETVDLHSALLDLTIWAVKEGHLKAEVKQ